MVVLERAKAVALVDRPRGDALLDSLAAAWGDSSLERTLAGLPRDPDRAPSPWARSWPASCEAEQDSLVPGPAPDRLARPPARAGAACRRTPIPRTAADRA